MAERHEKDQDTPVVAEPAQEIAGPQGEGAGLKQEHTVTKDSVVTIHGGIFAVKDGIYAWHLKDPAGESRALGNARASEPWFIPETVGKYVVTLQTTEGKATLTFNVIE